MNRLQTVLTLSVSDSDDYSEEIKNWTFAQRSKLLFVD